MDTHSDQSNTDDPQGGQDDDASIPLEQREARLAALAEAVLQQVLDIAADMPSARNEVEQTVQMRDALRFVIPPDKLATALAILTVRAAPLLIPTYRRYASQSPAIRAAIEALNLAEQGHLRQACEVVNRNQNCEEDALYLMAVAWIDAYMAHAVGPLMMRAPHRAHMLFVDPETGSEHTTPPPAAAWLGKLIRARGESDADAFNAAWHELDDLAPPEAGARLQTLLASVAQTKRTLPPQWGNMGATDKHGPGCSCPE